MGEGISLSPQEMGISIPKPEKSPQTPELSSPLEKASSGYLEQQRAALLAKLQERTGDLKAMGIAIAVISTFLGSVIGLQKIGLSPEMSGNITSGALFVLGLRTMVKRMNTPESDKTNDESK